MPRRASKKKADPIRNEPPRQAPPDQAAGSGSGGEPEPTPRSGLPAPESIVSETEFTSPKGAKYLIIKTRETDPYDKPKRPKESRKRKKD
jgi:hypothetical protein